MTGHDRKIEYLPIAQLKENKRNPKSHDLHTINASIDRFGVLDPIVLDGRTKQIISGHGRKNTLEGMEAAGDTPPEGVKQDQDGTWLVPVATGWASRTDHEATAALIAMNRTTELGGWVDDELLSLLDELAEHGDFTGVGYDETTLQELEDELQNLGQDTPTPDDQHTPVEEIDAEPVEVESSGQAFKFVDILWGEPEHKVHNGETYILGDRHIMVIAKLADEHHLWSKHLDGRIFAPYPDVYVLLGARPKQQDFLLVQPNHYLAGHTLDKWASVHGEDSIKKIGEKNK